MAKTEIMNNDAVTVRVNAEGVKDAAGAVVETVEETIEAAEQVVRNNPVVLTAVAIVAAGVGGFVGYKYAVKKLTTHYDRIMEEELARVDDYYKRQLKQGEFSTPEGAVQALGAGEVSEESVREAGEAITRYAGREVGDETPVGQARATRSRVFASPAELEVWNQELEEARRSPDIPYIISKEEHLENDLGFAQPTITYYAGDDVLADEAERPIDQTDSTVGDANLLRFGYGSRDPRILYVRNEKLQLDFEVLLHDGKYAEEVLGFDKQDDSRELRHAAQQRRRSADE